MKPAIYKPGEKVIVAGTVQWGTQIHCNSWDEVLEYSKGSEFFTNATQYQADETGVLKKPLEYRSYLNGVPYRLKVRLMSDEVLKSIQAAQLHNKWCARIRTNHREMFFGFESDYTMHQAQMLSDSIKKDVATMGLIDAVYSNICLVAKPCEPMIAQ